MTPAFDEILAPPDDVELELLHERAYIVRAYRKGDSTLLIRGAVRDQKPPGLYIADDPDVMTMHHMIVELEVAVPSMEITSARAVMETHPNEVCPDIEPHYERLVGLSITRGFTHKVRELFGGPRGCTHITALLQAMGPVANQSLWSMRMSTLARSNASPEFTPADQERNIAANLNTCHVWAEDGTHVQELRSGRMEMPLFIRRRLAELGRSPDSWQRR
jgi:hypothetical protein